MKEKKPIEGNIWQTNITQAIALINSSSSFLFSGDIDPDSVGSMLSLALYLNQLDKEVFIIIPEPLRGNLDFFEKIIQYNSIRILTTPEEIDTVKNYIDMVIFCDTANTKLVPLYSQISNYILSKKPHVVEIDHHFGADSEELTDYGIKLFRKANANTEIIGEILEMLYNKNPERPNPFSQRNIILGLITGILGDTTGGKVIHYKEDYKRWMEKLGEQLKNITRWRNSTDNERIEDCRTSKFGNPTQVLDYLNKVSKDQGSSLKSLNSRIESKGNIGFLSLLPPTYQEVNRAQHSIESDWFFDLMGLLLSSVPEKSGYVGVIIFEGKNAAGENCVFIKIRRAINFSGIDLRTAEGKIKELFGNLYMGGGGHAGAVSFRIHRLDEKDLLAQLENLFDFINGVIGFDGK
jgi:nanoRNase/pAp phosphatase (c-di-AMP/oligoRNAs hydrolase)